MSDKFDRFTVVIDGDNSKFELTAKNTVSSLGKVGRAANDSNGKVNKLSTGLRNASTNAAAFQGPLGGISGRLGAMATLLTSANPLMVGLGLAISGVSLVMIGAVKEFDKFDLRNKKQEAILKSTGHAAGFAAHELDTMARSVALNTLASVEGIKDTQNVLLTFKGVSETVFKSAIVASQDMAAVMGGDSKTAALQLGKALESPAEGISALKKAGVTFSQAEKDMIRDMEASGRVFEAQTFILETLKDQIGGAGNAEADTLSGAVDTLGHRWSDLKTNIADSSGAASGMQAFVNRMAAFVYEIDQMIVPEDKSRLAELWVEKENLLVLMEKTGARGSGARSTKLAEINKEAKEIEGRLAKNKIDAQAADDAALKFQAGKSEELQLQKAAADAKDLSRIQTKGARAVAAMEMQFADEEQKINLNYDKNLAKIELWQVSEKELRRRGYEDMEALRDEYRGLADEKLNQDFLNLESKISEQHNKKLAAEEKQRKEKEKMQERAANIRLGMEKSLHSNLMGLGHTLAKDNKKLQLAMLAVETFIGAKQAVIAGYVAGAEAAKSLAGTGPQGPALALAANASMISMGYSNAAVIGATGIAQGISMSKGGSSGGSVLSSFESGVESNIQSNDEAITSINSTSERRAGGDVVYSGIYIEKVETMDSESFDEFAQRHSNSFAKATATGYEEYGVRLGA
jgi:hypothetical protein